MFITPAYAQGAPGGSDFLIQFMPFILILAILYFLIIRPQQKRQREHREMLAAVRRGDSIVTTGGLIAKVNKVVDENELTVDLAEGVRVRMLKQYVAEVRGKGEPAAADAKPAAKTATRAKK